LIVKVVRKKIVCQCEKQQKHKEKQ